MLTADLLTIVRNGSSLQVLRWRMAKENVVHIQNGMLLSCKENQNQNVSGKQRDMESSISIKVIPSQENKTSMVSASGWYQLPKKARVRCELAQRWLIGAEAVSGGRLWKSFWALMTHTVSSWPVLGHPSVFKAPVPQLRPGKEQKPGSRYKGQRIWMEV